MGNSKSAQQSPLELQWGGDNVQKFMVKGHKNKIFGCDVVLPSPQNTNELWLASCSADGRILIHEVLIETSAEKQRREKILSSRAHESKSLTKSKSLSSIAANQQPTSSANRNPKKRPFEIELNRLLHIPLDSTVCFTLSLHKNCRHVATCVDT